MRNEATYAASLYRSRANQRAQCSVSAASGRATPIVFITAHENGMAETTAMAAGAAAFFQKPFDEKDLLGAICKSLNLQRP